ncbi:MAG: response regulator [Cyanobacteria bacterium HKST-UBA04]|nr:response regulator [Cyanobacteria bacterium HKST-UBA04]MCA9842242.1 response regulator [Cyanobacteria bacterium HKST-UBA03]
MTAQTSATATAPAGTKTYKLLLIDDESSIRDNLKEYLENHHHVGSGYSLSVDEAATVAEGVDCLKTTAYDLVISDINLPDSNGFELLRQARAMYPGIKAALITAYDLDSYIRMAKEDHIYNIITKTAPFNFEELSRTVHNLLFPDEAMGLETYLEVGASQIEHRVMKNSDDIMKVHAELVAFMKPFDLPDHDALSVVMVEALTNAVYHAPRDEAGEEKYIKGEHIDQLLESETVDVKWGVDGDKLGVSIRDKFGAVKASDVLFWLDRNISGESIFDTHGRGMYLIHRLTHRVIVNLWRGKSTELILLHYLSDPPADNKPLAINEF